MTMSLEEFRAALVRADSRSALGLQLTDIEAQQVAADVDSSQGWYAYWLATNPAPQPDPTSTPAPPAGSTPPPPVGSTSQAPPPPSGEPSSFDAPPPPYLGAAAAGGVATGADQPTLAYAAATPTYPGYDQTGAAPAYPGYGQPGDGGPATKSRVGLWVTLSILGALILIAAIVVVAAFATARHWTKVDVPEQPETFRSEVYETGRFDVMMDDVNPCFVNQDWTDCTNLMVATYEANCAGVELTETATLTCTRYSGAIDEMRALDGDGYFVATLGTYGTLSRTAETDTRQVSNDDYEPAVTHEAVCYFEFIGECE